MTKAKCRTRNVTLTEMLPLTKNVSNQNLAVFSYVFTLYGAFITKETTILSPL